MTSNQQRAALQRQIWQIANDVRGSVDGWDSKQYVLGTLSYRFISENFASYIEADDESINYAELGDEIITPDIKDDAIETKGYFIYLSAMQRTVVKDVEIKALLKQALTDRIDDRTLFMKGIDVSYSYEGYSEFKTEEL